MTVHTMAPKGVRALSITSLYVRNTRLYRRDWPSRGNWKLFRKLQRAEGYAIGLAHPGGFALPTRHESARKKSWGVCGTAITAVAHTREQSFPSGGHKTML